jgi:hypothetical protein
VNAFEFVIVLLIIVLAFTIIRHKLGIPVRSMREMKDGAGSDEEKARLQAQVSKLQDRINVLDRIVTDRGADTAAQIEALRERDRIPKGEDD